MYRTRLVIFVLATAAFAACAVPTSPDTAHRSTPRSLHDETDSSADSTHGGYINPNGL